MIAPPKQLERKVQRLSAAMKAQDWLVIRQLAQDCLRAAPDDPFVLRLAGRVALEGGADPQQALALIERALKRAPDEASILSLLCRARQECGDRDGAAAVAERRIQLDPAAGSAYFDLATIAPDRARRHKAVMEQLAAHPKAPALMRAGLLNALGRLYEREGAAKQAFAAFQEAKQRQNTPYHRDIVETRLAETRAAFRRAIVDHAEGPCADERLVFIVGLPRSGSTLVEQMLAGHSQVCGVGETTDLAFVLSKWCSDGGDYRQSGRFFARLPQDGAAIAADVLRRLEPRLHSGVPRRVIEKNPAYFLYLGEIATLFPRARFIMTERDPRDVWLSCLRTFFTRGQGFTRDLDRFLHYFRAQQAFAAHYKTVLGDRLLTVRYEALASNPEAEAPRLLAHLGLDWDPACLLPNGAHGRVGTASALQVREPIHTRSIGAWRRYEAEMAPLTRALAASEAPRGELCRA